MKFLFRSPLNTRFKIRLDGTVMLLVIGVVGVLTYLSNYDTVLHQIALGGFSPIEWVNYLSNPAGFTADFPNGTQLYARSLFMHVYPLANQWLGVPPDKMVLFVLGLEIVCLCLAYAYLCKALPGTAYPAIIGISVLFAAASNLGLLEISVIWRPFYMGLFYNVADAARLFAIVLFLKKRWLPAALFCAFAIATHTLVGGLALLCMVAMACAAQSIYVKRQSIFALFLCICLSIGWMSLQQSASLVATGIPQDTWLALTRLMSYHWYTLDLGLLTSNAVQTSIPLFTLLVLFFHYLPDMGATRPAMRVYATGVLVMVSVCALGVAFSIWWPQPFLIKLNLQRASMLAITLASPVVIAGLIKEIRSSSVFVVPAAWVLLLSPFIGLAVLPAGVGALLIVVGMLRQKAGSETVAYRYWCLAMSVLASTLVCTWVWSIGVSNLDVNKVYLFGDIYIWTLGLVLTTVTLLLRRTAYTAVLPAMIVLVVGVASIKWIQSDHVTKSASKERAVPFREAQEWARAHTAPNTLFFVDPLITYGWRDFSQRPSFGNFREWLHTSWLYDSDVNKYREGLRRFEEFGFSLAPYLAVPPLQARRVYSDFDQRHYELGDSWRIDLAKRYGISYYVLDRNKLSPTRIPIAFINSHFVILDVTGARNNSNFLLPHVTDTRSSPSPFILQRIADLEELRAALADFYSVNGKYPQSQKWDGLHSNWGKSTPDWIVGLAPNYIGTLPRDPRKNTDGGEQYLYQSNGTDYKLIAHGNPNDCAFILDKRAELVDPARDCSAYGFWTEGAESW